MFRNQFKIHFFHLQMVANSVAYKFVQSFLGLKLENVNSFYTSRIRKHQNLAQKSQKHQNCPKMVLWHD